jgi:Lipopolysaccharide kinase (Kdo/WaaP) family
LKSKFEIRNLNQFGFLKGAGTSILTIRSMATASLHPITDRRRRFLVCPSYEDYFPATEYGSYDAFLSADGEPVKSERRTRVVVLRRRTNARQEESIRSFVLKIYHYPLLPRIRTGLRISKAEQEFNSLRYLNQQGVPAAEPVAFGVEQTRLGFVRSCFVITGLIEGAVNLSRWRSESARQQLPNAGRNHFLLEQLGRMFRRLHEVRFFLLTAKTKNILIRAESTRSPEIFFIDVPYARTLRWRPTARWAQGRDLGLFLGNFYPALTESEMTAFYEGYLPDPLGGSSVTLRGHAQRAMRSKQNLTPVSAVVHGLKRNLRRKLAAWRSRDQPRHG